MQCASWSEGGRHTRAQDVGDAMGEAVWAAGAVLRTMRGTVSLRLVCPWRIAHRIAQRQSCPRPQHYCVASIPGTGTFMEMEDSGKHAQSKSPVQPLDLLLMPMFLAARAVLISTTRATVTFWQGIQEYFR